MVGERYAYDMHALCGMHYKHLVLIVWKNT